MTERRIPIAETFLSVQGEGLYAGCPTLFIRTAHCCVGKAGPKDRAPYETCTLWDGRQFTCDTDYRAAGSSTARDLLAIVPPREKVQRVTITGGEPLMWDLSELVSELTSRGQDVSIETSGVRPIAGRGLEEAWITLSPKHGVLDECLIRANEIKLLVDERFSEREAAELLSKCDLRSPVYIQPVNPVQGLDRDNLQRCLKLLKRHPDWRLSSQMHKVWEVE